MLLRNPPTAGNFRRYLAAVYKPAFRERCLIVRLGDSVLVHNTERPKAHLIRVVIGSERKRVVGIEPPMIGVAPFIRFSDFYHQFLDRPLYQNDFASS